MSVPGWYPDPAGSGQQRYFDGSQWTGHYAPAAPPPGPPVKQSGGALKAIFITVAVVALGIILLATAANNDGGGSSSAESSRSSVARTSEVAPAGSPVRDGKFEFRVLEMRRSGKAGNLSNPYMTVNAQGEFIILTIGVTNIGSEPQSYFGQNQKLVDTNGREYASDTSASMYMNDTASNINPGNSIQVVEAFDVPPGTVANELVVHDSMLSGGTRVAIDDPRGR